MVLRRSRVWASRLATDPGRVPDLRPATPTFGSRRLGGGAPGTSPRPASREPAEWTALFRGGRRPRTPSRASRRGEDLCLGARARRIRRRPTRAVTRPDSDAARRPCVASPRARRNRDIRRTGPSPRARSSASSGARTFRRRESRHVAFRASDMGPRGSAGGSTRTPPRHRVVRPHGAVPGRSLQVYTAMQSHEDFGWDSEPVTPIRTARGVDPATAGPSAVRCASRSLGRRRRQWASRSVESIAILTVIVKRAGLDCPLAPLVLRSLRMYLAHRPPARAGGLR